MGCFVVKSHVRGTKGAACKGLTVAQVSKKKPNKKPSAKKEKGFVETVETLAIKRRGFEAGAGLNKKVDELGRRYDPKRLTARYKARQSIKKALRAEFGSTRGRI